MAKQSCVLISLVWLVGCGTGPSVALAKERFGYLNVLDAQRTLFEMRGQLGGALATYHTTVVEVEGGLGQALPVGEIKPNNSLQRKPSNRSNEGENP